MKWKRSSNLNVAKLIDTFLDFKCRKNGNHWKWLIFRKEKALVRQNKVKFINLFFDPSNFLKTMNQFCFTKLNQLNPGHKTLKLCNILVEARLATSTSLLDIEFKNHYSIVSYRIAEQLNTWYPRKLVKSSKISKLGRGRGSTQFPFKLWYYWSKIMQLSRYDTIQ